MKDVPQPEYILEFRKKVANCIKEFCAKNKIEFTSTPDKSFYEHYLVPDDGIIPYSITHLKFMLQELKKFYKKIEIIGVVSSMNIHVKGLWNDLSGSSLKVEDKGTCLICRSNTDLLMRARFDKKNQKWIPADDKEARTFYMCISCDELAEVQRELRTILKDDEDKFLA